ncbi:hypothetical protein EDB89DRAFT_1915297 [Lactarius sanguifluus]|nr:hypothetical protein EDB89DRAFT_1915297 [Lactarius sanguifluus]
MLQCGGVGAGSCAADRRGGGVGRGWPCCWPWQSQGLAVLVVTGLVDVAPGLVGVAPGLVGVTLRLVGVTPGLGRLGPVPTGLYSHDQPRPSDNANFDNDDQTRTTTTIPIPGPTAATPTSMPRTSLNNSLKNNNRAITNDHDHQHRIDNHRPQLHPQHIGDHSDDQDDDTSTTTLWQLERRHAWRHFDSHNLGRNINKSTTTTICRNNNTSTTTMTTHRQPQVRNINTSTTTRPQQQRVDNHDPRLRRATTATTVAVGLWPVATDPG